MIKSVSQDLGYAPPITLTTNGSVLPVPGMATMSLFQKSLGLTFYAQALIL